MPLAGRQRFFFRRRRLTMEDQNIQIVRECVDQIFNAKHFDRIYDYYNEQCILISPPYVGLGFALDDSSGVQHVILSVADNGPASGKLQVGDVLLRAHDAYGTWEGYEQLHARVWGQGKLGTPVTLTVLRDGETIEVPLVRGRVEGFHNTIAEILSLWQHTVLSEMPDLHTKINQILGSGDRVAYFATNTCTSTLYHQSAVWTECNIVRLEDGKIVEWWGVEDGLSQLRQFGFRMTEPEKELA